MGRPLRCREPGTYYFVTTRCVEARFLLRPDAELTSGVGYWLARSLSRFEGMALHGAVVLSNHLHLLVCDRRGELSRFMEYFLGNLGRAVNRLRCRSGPCFHRRYDDGGQVLDTVAAVERLAYLVANPVSAGLVARHDDWPGLLLYARDKPRRHWFVRFDASAWRAARGRRRTRRRVDPAPFHEHVSLTVEPLPFAWDADGAALLGATALLNLTPAAGSLIDTAPRAIPSRDGYAGANRAALAKVRSVEAAARRHRAVEGRSVMGRERILAEPPTARPRRAHASPRPVCHTSLAQARALFAAAIQLFRKAYTTAAIAFHRRAPGVAFPPFSLLPGGAPAT